MIPYYPCLLPYDIKLTKFVYSYIMHLHTRCWILSYDDPVNLIKRLSQLLHALAGTATEAGNDFRGTNHKRTK